MILDLDRRRGWPPELRTWLERFPRETWREQRSASAQFWLDVHDGFRREIADVRTLVDDYRAARKGARELGLTGTPRIRMLVAHLHGHHGIEDIHYFPAFRAIDARLAPGIDALAGDHRLLVGRIETLAGAGEALLAALARDAAGTGSAARHAADALAAAADAFTALLLKHFDDEEDLVIPLMIGR